MQAGREAWCAARKLSNKTSHSGSGGECFQWRDRRMSVFILYKEPEINNQRESRQPKMRRRNNEKFTELETQAATRHKDDPLPVRKVTSAAPGCWAVTWTSCLGQQLASLGLPCSFLGVVVRPIAPFQRSSMGGPRALAGWSLVPMWAHVNAPEALQWPSPGPVLEQTPQNVWGAATPGHPVEDGCPHFIVLTPSLVSCHKELKSIIRKCKCSPIIWPISSIPAISQR